jgi:hypothetical protein
MPGALTRFTRDAERDGGEVVREFDVRSAAVVIGAGIGVLFLVFFLAAFIPWLLSNGMTAAVEGLMHQVGFDEFSAGTLGDWILVLLVGALFTAFIVAIAVSILWLYNLISKRTGVSMSAIQPEVAGAARAELAEPAEVVDDDVTFDELYAEAQRKQIPGRSSMSKAELLAALEPKPKRRAPRRTTSTR